MIKPIFILVFAMLLSFQLKAQYKVRFIVSETCPIKQSEVFISGTFNSWDSLADSRYRLSAAADGKRQIELLLPKGEYLYKYTGGNWLSVEKSNRSQEREERKIRVISDMTVLDTVIDWRNLFMKNVHWSIAHTNDDTTKLSLLASLAFVFQFNADHFNTDSTLYYLEQTLRQLQIVKSSQDLQNWTGYNDWLLYIQEINAAKLHSLGNYPKSLELRLDNLKLSKNAKRPFAYFISVTNLIEDYMAMKDYTTVIEYTQKLQKDLVSIDPDLEFYEYAFTQVYRRLTESYFNLGLRDSALHYAIPLAGFTKARNMPYAIPASCRLLGNIYAQMEMNDSAFINYRTGLSFAIKHRNSPEQFRIMVSMAKLFSQKGETDSALFYARSALEIIEKDKIELQVWGDDANTFLADISPLVADLYKANGQLDSAYKYLQLSIVAKDSLFNITKARDFQNLGFNESLRQLQMEQQGREARQQYETSIKVYGLITIMSGIMILAFILYRNNQQKQIANSLLASQKNDIERTLDELRTTQKQLIQSEKMASLGELTAGIAHEIQNPLNFVNNFSEVSAELIVDMVDEVDNGNFDEVKAIAMDVQQNLEKINHHGHRASSIVKGMLEHSRTSTGQKELTDINALCDEYLRLSYHGLRAKDKSFNASFETHFDPNLPKIAIIPQDIGRVLLNLINNAFFAVNERKNLLDLAEQRSPANLTDLQYEPIVSITTRQIANGQELTANSQQPTANSQLLIAIKDNGSGIPDHIKEKIFQPFFTTKPTGQGTGLGLSLAYDIVKAHVGELTLDSTEEVGTEFTIKIPIA